MTMDLAINDWIQAEHLLRQSVPYVQAANLCPESLTAQQAHGQGSASEMQDVLLALSLPKADKVVGTCRMYQVPLGDWEVPDANTVDPGWWAQMAMGGQQRESKGETVKQWVDRLMREWAVAKVSVVEPPLHGRYREGTSGLAPNGDHLYRYIPPSKDFRGEDRWSFLVEFKNGKRALVRYQMTRGEPEDNDKCHTNLLASWPSEQLMALTTGTNNLPAWQTQSQLSALLAGIASTSPSTISVSARPVTNLDRPFQNQGAQATQIFHKKYVTHFI